MKRFHYRQFEDIEALCELKSQRCRSISVVIPTLNEAATIGSIITVVRERLVDCFPLVDEIVVIDSGSADDTCEQARRAGAMVYLAEEIAPEQGHVAGKGENLWKSLFVTHGDISVFVDGDIRDFHEGFVAGLVGPLLEEEELSYVKAFYRRPLHEGGLQLPEGGGRVSEILVRPLFAMFYPSLVDFVQPLAGEYAVRRALLEKLPFPRGYGVETSHLIDVLHQCGMESFAQCDMESRRHRNRDIAELGGMANEILQVFMMRAERDGIMNFSQKWLSTYAERGQSGGSESAAKNNLELVERPPYHTLHHPPEA